VLEDLGSTNGTLLNGQRVLGSQSLRPGDLIEIGAVKIKVNRA
jgi:pSer/pThr/pTyr-binding forkhead associated (FHA) protein